MAHDNGNGFPSGACPDSDHITAERARLKQASTKHFAQMAGSAPPAPKGPSSGRKAPAMPPTPPMDDDDGAM
jgi:hypothetical protein